LAWILHLSDPHLGDLAAWQKLDETKILTPQEDLASTQTVFRRTLAALRQYIAAVGPPDALVISGDLTWRHHESGFSAFAELLDEYADVFPDPANIVVVPGNHDVDWNVEPGQRERYDRFCAVTRPKGCATPLLDGVDFNVVGPAKLDDGVVEDAHIVEHQDFLIIPINSSNWCGTMTAIPDGWTDDDWKQALTPLEDDMRTKAFEELKKLRQQDMARVSQRQIDCLRQLFSAKGIAIDRGQDPRPRVAVLHHQLLPVSTRVEVRPFESLINLGLLRETLRDFGVDVVLHGHKHESAIYWDLARGANDPIMFERRALVIASPGQFKPHQPVMRALTLQANPGARNLDVLEFNGVDASTTKLEEGRRLSLPLWLGQMESESAERTFVRGRTTHEAYARLCAQFELHGGATLANVVCEIADTADAATVPPHYPDVSAPDKQAWFDGLVRWWQLRHSRLVRENVLEFNHGERIRTRWGDQIERAARLLCHRDGSSRGLVVLISPDETGLERDETPPENGTYPAFALAEFALVSRGNRRELDCFAYFRKQEMRYWWPINAAELKQLQEDVRRQLDKDHRAEPGRIVTFSAIALYGDEVPRVAVTELDRAVDEEGAIWELAAAVAFPDSAAAADGRGRWARVLEELEAKDRRSPPRPRLGHKVLLQELDRVATVAPESAAATVAAQLRRLNEVYRGLPDRLGMAQKPLLETPLRDLRAAVEATLPAQAGVEELGGL
jgi:3',5'-cyclic AMP phosphodiesterase CpdA